jgi:hypothetical protein
MADNPYRWIKPQAMIMNLVLSASRSRITNHIFIGPGEMSGACHPGKVEVSRSPEPSISSMLEASRREIAAVEAAHFSCEIPFDSCIGQPDGGEVKAALD